MSIDIKEKRKIHNEKERRGERKYLKTDIDRWREQKRGGRERGRRKRERKNRKRKDERERERERERENHLEH